MFLKKQPQVLSAYVEKYDIKSIRSPIYLWHSSVHNRGEYQEWEDIVIGTNSFTLITNRK